METPSTARTPANSRVRSMARNTTSRSATGAGEGTADATATDEGADATATDKGAVEGAADEGASEGAAERITRLRSGRIPCGRNHRKITISRPIATHSSDGIRFGGRLFEVGMYRVTS